MVVSVGEAIGLFIKNNTYLIIVAALVFMVLALNYSQNIYMATGIETLVFKDTQIYKDIDYYDENFQATNFLILITSDDVLDPDVLEAMQSLHTQIMNNPKIESVEGLHTLVQKENKAANGIDGIPGNKREVEELISRIPAGAASMAMPDRHHTIMTVQLRGAVEEKDEARVLDDVKSTIRWAPMPPGTTAVVTGETAMMLDIQKEMMKSMMTMLLTAIILMVVALWFTFSHSKWRLLPLPIVLIGVIYTGGIMGITGVPLTMVSMAVFPIIIGLGVEYAIQFQNRMMEELGSGRSPDDAIIATVRNIGPPVFYSMTTASLGFMAILTSPIPMVYDFGLMCLIGVITCFITALFVLISILYVMASVGGAPKMVRQGAPGRGVIENVIETVAEFTTRHPSIIVVAVIAMVTGYALDPYIGVEIDTSTFAPQDLSSVVLFRSLGNIVGYKTSDMIIQVKAHDVTGPEAIRWIEDFSDYEKKNNPDVLSVSSITTTLAAYNNGTVPDTAPEIKSVLGRVPDDVKKRYVDQYMTTGIIRMVIQDQPTDKKISMLHRVEKDLKFLLPPAGIESTLGGESQVTLMTLGSMQSDRLAMTMLGGLSVLIGLLIFYRGDWVKSVVPVLAVVIVTGLSSIVMALLKMKYTPLSVTLGALTIGIGVDFSILHMQRYYEEKAKGYPPAVAMRIATAKIGNAIFASATTVIAGFGALVMSNFSILSNFGIVTIIDFLMALASAFIIMPPLLVTLDIWRAGRSRTDVKNEETPI